jgi:hypothetical protein
MIDTLYIANYLQNVLNQNSLGLDFLVFADEGDLVSTRKVGAKEINYTQGLVEVTSSTIVPVKNITFHTINAQLMILADTTDAGFVYETDKKRKQSRNVIDIKQCLYEMIDKLNGQTTNMEIDNKTYNVTISMSRPTDGQKDTLGHIVDMLPLYMNISFNVFENGVNTNNVKLILNHEDIHFTRMVLSKVKTADQNNFAKDKASKTLALVGGKSIDLVMPTLDTAFSRVVMEDFLKDNMLNRAIDVRIETPLGNTQFIGILGTTQISGDIGANLGYNISIVQGVEKALEYRDGYWAKNYWRQEQLEKMNYTISSYIDAGESVYWGDGTFDYHPEFNEKGEPNSRKSITHKYNRHSGGYEVITFNKNRPYIPEV